MPVLALEPMVNPEDIFSGPPRNAEGDWWVLHVKPRQEKSLSRDLANLGIGYFLPLVRNIIRSRKRVLHSYLPLFPGYLFLFGSPEDRIKSFNTRRVVRTLEVANQDQIWHDLSQVNRLLQTGMQVTPEKELRAGNVIEISSGPLAGLRGKILRSVSGNRFVVQVDFIQQGASILFQDADLRTIQTASGK